MVEVYDSHEQGEIVKKWLVENGSAMVMGLVIAFGGLFGFKQFQQWSIGKRQQASAEYQVMVELLSEESLDAAVANYQTLKNNFANSPYTTLASLHMAKARIESGQADLAVQLYQHVIEKGDPPPVRLIARSRLARLYVDLDDLPAARQILDSAVDAYGFESQFAEIRGDIALQEGNQDAAIAFYQDALDQLDTGVGNRGLLELKLQSLGVEVTEDGAET